MPSCIAYDLIANTNISKTPTNQTMAHLSLCLQVLASISMVLSLAAGTQFEIGGSGTWDVPNDSAMSYDQWAEKHRFKIGDSTGNNSPFVIMLVSLDFIWICMLFCNANIFVITK